MKNRITTIFSIILLIIIGCVSNNKNDMGYTSFYRKFSFVNIPSNVKYREDSKPVDGYFVAVSGDLKDDDTINICQYIGENLIDCLQLVNEDSFYSNSNYFIDGDRPALIYTMFCKDCVLKFTMIGSGKDERINAIPINNLVYSLTIDDGGTQIIEYVFNKHLKLDHLPISKYDIQNQIKGEELLSKCEKSFYKKKGKWHFNSNSEYFGEVSFLISDTFQLSNDSFNNLTIENIKSIKEWKLISQQKKSFK